MRKFTILAAMACAVLLAVLIYAIDPVKIASGFANVSAGHILAGLAVVQLQIVLSGLRWQFTAGRLGHVISLRQSIGEYYVSSFLNLILPGGMAGDAVRAYRSRMDGEGGWKRPAAAVLLERLSGQIAFFALAAFGLAIWPLVFAGHPPEGFGVFLPGLVVVVIVGGIIVFAARRAWLPARFQRAVPMLQAAFLQGGAWRVQITLSLIIVAGYVATFMIASDAIGAPLPVSAAITAIPLCLLTMLIPAGIGGWGTREVAAAAIWPLFGFSAAQGVAASLLYGLLSLVGAGLPGLFFVAISLYRGRIDRA